MRLGVWRRGALAVVLATMCGCTCHGKGQVGTGAAEEHEDTPTKAEPVEEKPAAPEWRAVEHPTKAEPQNRFEADRVGWVKAKLGDRTLDLSVLPRKHNRVALTAKPPVVIVDGYASEDGGEHLRVHMQGVPFERSKGRPLMPIQGNKAWLVAVTYQDAQGKTFVGKVGNTPGVQVSLQDVDMGMQLVSGTFSGQLTEVDGEATLEVRDGSFKTVLGD